MAESLLDIIVGRWLWTLIANNPDRNCRHARACTAVAFSAVIALVLSACGRSSRPPATDSAFAHHVVWQPADSIPQLRLISDVRICPSEKQSATCILLQATKRAYVDGRDIIFFDAREGLVKVDSFGNYLTGIGQLGHEAGEYYNVTALARDKYGALIIWDPYHSRVTRFGDSVATFGWVRRTPDAVRIGPNGALGLSVDAAKHAGDNAPAIIAAISLTGRLGPPLATVTALATRSEGSDLIQIPLLIWRTPMWDILSDGRIAYVPFGHELRIEIYAPTGVPSLLITGRLPFQAAPITPALAKHLEDVFFQQIYQEPIDSAILRCSHLERLPNQPRTVRCQTVDYARSQGARLPTTFPPITGVAHLAEGAFAIQTSHIDHGLTSWLLVDTRGRIIGQFALHSSARVIGGTIRRIVIADTAGGRRLSATWNTVKR